MRYTRTLYISNTVTQAQAIEALRVKLTGPVMVVDGESKRQDVILGKAAVYTTEASSAAARMNDESTDGIISLSIPPG